MAPRVGRGLLRGWALAVCLLWAGAASAARVVLDPVVRPRPGPETFQVSVEDLPNGALDITLELRFEDEADLLAISVSDEGNPFLFPGAGVITEGCMDGAGICALFGGSDFGAVSPGPTIVLGELTLTSNGAPLDVVVSFGSRYTDPVLGSQRLNENQVVGGLPEPGSVVLLTILTLGFAARRPRSLNKGGIRCPPNLEPGCCAAS